MRKPALRASLFLLTILMPYMSVAAIVDESHADVTLTAGWRITQDVRHLGEATGWYKPDFHAEWQPIERVDYLQLLLAPQPYFGRNLRYFNEAPWWYRIEFSTPHLNRQATLRFEGVDYFAKVWLNGTLLGEHEGYADPFEFEVANFLRSDRANVLIVEVSSPWDHSYKDPALPLATVVRDLLKGSYEHADGLIQRDVNPVGIWRPVRLLFHDDVHESAEPVVTSSLSPDHHRASLKITWPVSNDGQSLNVNYVVHVREKKTGSEVATTAREVILKSGLNTLAAAAVIDFPKLWTTWDRGEQPLYEVSLDILKSGVKALSASRTFGVRSVELRHTSDEMRFFINEQPIYLRGTSYWPELYLSKMDGLHYEQDMGAVIRAGFNAIRVHVHTENPELYEICDRLGIAVLQDNDLNWTFPTDEKFSARATSHFATLIKMLINHPSVIAWVAMNEVVPYVTQDRAFKEGLAPKLLAAAHEMDPTRPVIADSGDVKDPLSGDVHDYRGSLSDNSSYFDISGSDDKLVTEFGVDAPPASSSLRAVPEAAERLRDVLPRVTELQDYQYHLLKYYIEHYRIHKYSSNAGYFQFMWKDLTPQSFYGIYDYWGVAKTEGLGGGLRALQESNQPVGIFMEHTDKPKALYAVNDSSQDLRNCIARWRVSQSGKTILEGSRPVQLGPDSREKVRDFTFPVKVDETYTIVLELLSEGGKLLAHNSYLNPFKPQPRPEGYPDRMDDELGMRIWWADTRN